MELEIMRVIRYKIHAPTVLDFLKQYILDILGIDIQSKTETKLKEEFALVANKKLHENNFEKNQLTE
jgi:hypothetical protein